MYIHFSVKKRKGAQRRWEKRFHRLTKGVGGVSVHTNDVFWSVCVVFVGEVVGNDDELKEQSGGDCWWCGGGSGGGGGGYYSVLFQFCQLKSSYPTKQ